MKEKFTGDLGSRSRGDFRQNYESYRKKVNGNVVGNKRSKTFVFEH